MSYGQCKEEEKRRVECVGHGGVHYTQELE